MAQKSLKFSPALATDDQETATEAVPDPILEEILSWAPTKSVLCWKTVSKPWLRMLDNPIFARGHFSRTLIWPLLVSSDTSNYCKSRRIMHLIEGQNVSDFDANINKFKLISRLDFNAQVAGPSKTWSRFRFRNVNVISCEGVLCWVLYDLPDGDCIFISNPVRGECASISPFPMDEDNFYAFIGIGFRQATNKFELLRMAGSVNDDDDEVTLWWPEVRTVGDRYWRRVGDGTSELDFLPHISRVVYVNGAIYWSYSFYKDLSTIYCFHFDSAIFQVIRPPKLGDVILESDSFPTRNMRLGALADSLYLSLVFPDGRVELWIMENGGVSNVQWNKLCDFGTTVTYFELDIILWSKGQYKAIKYLQGGEILMHDRGGTLLVYDPMTKEKRHFCVIQDLKHFCLYGPHEVSHVRCLVKLKEALNIDEEGLKLTKEESTGRFWRVK